LHEQGIDELTVLNRDYVASVQSGDVKRFDEILAQDFYCTNPDKSLVDRAGFLEQTALPVTIKNLGADDVKIRVMGDFAIIHANQLHHDRWIAGPRPLHRLLVQAEREVAGGVGACGEVDRAVIAGHSNLLCADRVNLSALPAIHHLE
jgi:Domain of unknown function (DUF4440)